MEPTDDMYVSDRRPELGEVWQESDGCLLTWVSVGWCAFGSTSVLDECALGIAKPVKRLLDATGKYVGSEE